ncbi:MAG: DUF3822 family protein [Flavobacteriaceae bacterium]|nr:DUF3822 family protein [Flavobacteriaceae bacterium]
MMVKKLKLKSNHLDLKKIQHKEISIQFSLDGFSFCVFDSDLQEFIIFHKYEFLEKINTPEKLLKKIQQLFITEEILQLKYDKISVIHDNNLSSFVPKALFNKKNLKSYVAFNNKVFNTDYFTFDSLVNQEMNLVYIPYININNFLIDQFGSFNYKHTSSILVENLLNYFTMNDGISFFVHVSKTHFEVIISKNKQLLFFNTFQHQTKEDFIYYILFTVEQLNLNVEQFSLQFLGVIHKESELYQIVHKYIRNVSFLENKLSFNRYLEINDTIIRENFSLFNF